MSKSKEELLNLQKLVLEDSPDKLMFSESELIKMAYFNAQEYLKIVYDSIELVNHTANPDVFFSRFKLLEENLYTLSLFEPYIKFNTEKPSDRLHIIHGMKQEEIRTFLNRYFDDAKKKADKMKTDKGKLGKYEKFYQNLQPYYESMNSENIEYAEKSYKSAIDGLKKSKENLKSTDLSEQKSEVSSVAIVESEHDSSIVKSSSISSGWNISISFGRSSSQNFDKALYLAKQAPKYDEHEYNGKMVYQATYGKDKDQYLAFIQLYEMISAWKSTAVFINGEMIDRKIIGGLNYCYGDKCRSGNSDFCYGTSVMTTNPFGCHRLQVSAGNHPWWSFSNQIGDYYYINKSEIKERIDSYGDNYKMCPCFDEAKIDKALKDLPAMITVDKYNELSGRSSLIYNVNVNTNPQPSSSQSSLPASTYPTSNQGKNNIKQQAKIATTATGGCLLPIISIVGGIVLCICLLL